MVKKTLPEILPTVGAPRTRVENWLMPDRLRLSTPFESPKRGRARMFSRINTLELATISAFVKAGASASSAAALAEMVVEADKGLPFGEPQREWCVIEAGDVGKGDRTDSLNLESLQPRLAKAWPPVLTVIHIGAIVRRVDALFKAG